MMFLRTGRVIAFKTTSNYRVCHGFRLWKRDDYFWLILTTFESSSIFGGSWGSIENRIEPKIKLPSANLACPNL